MPRAPDSPTSSSPATTPDWRTLGFALGSPRDPDRRGGHVSLHHPHAYPITQALIDRNVIPDFRTPDTIRLGLAPLYTTFTEVWDAVEAIADVVESVGYRGYPAEPEGVT